MKINLKDRQRHYKALFAKDTTSSKAVMADLARFCRFMTTTFHADEKTTWIMEGRRQVFLRILRHTKLSPEEALALFGGLEPAEKLSIYDANRSQPLAPQDDQFYESYRRS